MSVGVGICRVTGDFEFICSLSVSVFCEASGSDNIMSCGIFLILSGFSVVFVSGLLGLCFGFGGKFAGWSGGRVPKKESGLKLMGTDLFCSISSRIFGGGVEMRFVCSENARKGLKPGCKFGNSFAGKVIEVGFIPIFWSMCLVVKMCSNRTVRTVSILFPRLTVNAAMTNRNKNRQEKFKPPGVRFGSRRGRRSITVSKNSLRSRIA